MIAEAEVAFWFLDKLEVLFDPPLPGSEQFNLQQRRAIETSGALATDRALLQQRGIFPCTHDSPAALALTAPPSRTMMAAKLKTRFSIPGEYI
jgi:hypothetical protein